MTKDELLAALRLQHIPHIGDTTAKKLIAYCGSPTAVFTDKVAHLLRIEGVGTYTLQELHNPVYLGAAERELAFLEESGLGYSYYLDEDYPYYLKHCMDSPLLLFHRGRIQLNNRRIISVVGTRNMTAYGRDFCEEFICEIAPMNPVIVSGFAYGVDICVQRAAIRHKLQTVSCLAHGLNQLYPRAHEKYRHDIELNGGFITEFWSSSSPERENFLRRNRIIAGMSEATVVVESAERGGSLVTADIAGSYNREVFAVPGRVNDPYSIGCNTLIRQHKAHMLTSAADLIYMLGWDAREQDAPVIQKRLFVDLDATESRIYQYLQDHGRQLLDAIALQCQVPVFKATSTLLDMEMKGVVRPLPGKLFEAL
jgi:DNA processing protein